MGPTYRAGALRESAIEALEALEKKTGIDSVAFELLGPPRLSKILYEAYLLKKCYGTFESLLANDPVVIGQTLERLMIENQDLRTRIVSIGIPILMASGNKLIRGSRMSIPADIPGRPDAAFDVTDEALNQWAHDGWVDLRPDNCARWQRRLEQILKEISRKTPRATSPKESLIGTRPKAPPPSTPPDWPAGSSPTKTSAPG